MTFKTIPTILTISILIILIPIFLLTTQTTEITIVPPHNYPQKPLATHYVNNIYLDQEQLNLNNEVIQYQIIFHRNDTINISLQMILQQTGIDFQPMCSFLMLTDGNKSVFKNTTMFFLYDIPTGSIIDANILGKRISIGGKLFNRILSKTRFHIGSACYYTEDIKVKNNTVWFLTIAQLDNTHKEILATSIKSNYEGMEIIQTERTNDMGFYTCVNNDFDGKYFGFKFLPYLPFGFSIAKNLQKEITTTKGSIIYFSSIGHRKGQISIEIQNETFTNTNKRSATFIYCGNQTGTWKFSASGIGFPWKHFVTLFYIDIDPHMKQ